MVGAVLHVDTGTERRGGQAQLLHLLRARPGDAVAMRPDAAWRGEVERLGNPVHYVDFRGAWRGTSTLAKVVRDVQPELIAAHTSHAHGHAWLAGGAPLVVHRRNDFVPTWISGPKYRAPLGYVAVSAAVREVLAGIGVPRDRIAVVHDGVDVARFAPDGPAWERPDRGAPGAVSRIGAVGALVEHKGHDVLIEAAARLRRLGRPVEVEIAGVGEKRDALERLALEREVPVRFLGAVEDVPGFLRSLDAFAHPSREEGLGQAVIEAMLVGVPVVASAAGGIPEVVAPGTGWLVPPGDPAALADTLAEALADGVARAAAAREHARRFDVAAMVTATEAAWSEALSRAGGVFTAEARG